MVDKHWLTQEAASKEAQSPSSKLLPSFLGWFIRRQFSPNSTYKNATKRRGLISDGLTVVIFHVGFHVVTAVIFVITKHALIEHLFAVSR